MLIQNHPVPVIAMVNGLATAAGCQLVASCDIAVASDKSSFATPGVNIGLFCSTPAVALGRAVPRKVIELPAGPPDAILQGRGWSVPELACYKDCSNQDILPGVWLAGCASMSLLRRCAGGRDGQLPVSLKLLTSFHPCLPLRTAS